MKIKSLSTIAMLLLVTIFMTACKSQSTLKSNNTFAELPDPTLDTLSDWSSASAGLKASFVTIDKRFPKSVLPELTVRTNEQVTGWKGEKQSAQILLWTTDEIEDVAFSFNDFKSDKGSLPASIAQARFVRYVMTDEFSGGCGQRKPEDFAASLSPDMLDDLTSFNVEKKTVRPVWVSVDIPSDATAGIYQSTIEITAKGEKPQIFTLELEVIDQLLP